MYCTVCTHLVAEAVEFGHTQPGVHEDLGAERRAQRVHREDAVEHYTDLHATLRITDSFIVDRSDKSPLSHIRTHTLEGMSGLSAGEMVVRERLTRDGGNCALSFAAPESVPVRLASSALAASCSFWRSAISTAASRKPCRIATSARASRSDWSSDAELCAPSSSPLIAPISDVGIAAKPIQRIHMLFCFCGVPTSSTRNSVHSSSTSYKYTVRVCVEYSRLDCKLMTVMLYL